MKSYKNKALLVALILGGLHLLLSISLFVMVQLSSDGQAGFAWFFMFDLDYPTAEIAYKALGNNTIMEALIDWWWDFSGNQGSNIKAILVFGIFGTLHWFLIGYVVTKLIIVIKLKLLLKRELNRG